MTNFPNLFSPLKVGPVTMKNRIETGPMSIVELNEKGAYTEEAFGYYESLAAGGAAVVTLGESIVASDNGMTHLQQIRFDNPDVPFTLQKMADRIHAHNCLINIEISHGGCMADPIYNNGTQCMGPTHLIDEWGDEIKEMTEVDMDRIADAFADAAEILRDCTFDMVMIHCGHGWLLHQFLSPFYNKRTDAYGGSIENRARFPLMVIDRVRERIGNSMAIEIRISGSEFLEGGLEIEDVTAFCKMCEDKVDLINLSAGMPWGKRMAISVFEERGINSEFSAAIKKEITKVPVTSVGGYTDPALMEQYLSEGRCDGFILGRSILADPQLPEKARTGREDEIHQCLRCFVCNNAQYINRGKLLRCAINPYAGRESTLALHKQPSARKIVVLGGGIGGLATALTAAQQGHRVSLYEKTDKLGGWLRSEEHLPFKIDMVRYADTLIHECKKIGVDIHLSSVPTPDEVKSMSPDLVVCAIGSYSWAPPVDGATQVPFALDALDQQMPLGKRIIMIGGGLVGCEISLHLATQGHEVTILEMRDDVAVDATADHRRFLMERLEPLVTIETSKTVSKISTSTVEALDEAGQICTYEADTVLLATGLKARTEEAEAYRSSDYDFVIIGDAKRARNVYSAVREGFDAAYYVR